MTRRVFNQIRKARPSTLLVAADGPRVGHPDDQRKIKEVRAIVTDGVDWPCKVITNYSNRNMGCRERPKSGIDWAFSLVEEVIILEDDCLPDLSFFTFCEDMLNRFRNEDRVMHVNGTNYIGKYLRPDSSYFFSKYVWVWGWATWRRAWKHYDYTMSTWDERLQTLSESFDTRREKAFWMSTFEKARSDWRAVQTWDYSWIYSCWTMGGLTVTTKVNLIENIGFGTDATHTNNLDSDHLRVPTENLYILQSPDRLQRSRLSDDMMFRAYAGDRINTCANFLGMLRVIYRQLAGVGK